MYLKKMEVVGFKSFAQRTVLEFHDGITIVVGPNGCGKSNVLDAIRWALGEQSPKTLRGQNMADIIFNGTQQLPASNYAEVSLTFDNNSRAMDIAYDEVCITRKLFRDGSSEYRLNKALVRLKDIHELLLSVGLGEGSYSFVMQGTIDRILTQSSDKKRIIFDEAAGILQYKEKKREVTRKLQDAEENLLRVEDIIIEVRRQRDTLGRQVQRAKKYQELNGELQELEKSLAVVKVKETRGRIDRLLDQLNVHQETDGKGHVELESLQKEHIEKDTCLTELRTEQEQLNRVVITLDSRVDNNRSRIEIFNQRIQESNERMGNIVDFKGQYTDRRKDQEQRIDSLNAELLGLQTLHTDVNSRIQSIQSDINSARDFVNNKTESVNFIKGHIANLEQEKENINKEIYQTKNNKQSATSRKHRLSSEIERNQFEISEYQKKYEELFTVIEEKEQTLQGERKVLSERQQELVRLSSDLENTGDALGEKEKELVRLNTRLDFIKNMNVSYQDLPYEEEATILFSEELPEPPAVLVGKMDYAPTRDHNGRYSVTTKIKVVSANVDKITELIEKIKAEIDELQNNIAAFKSRRGNAQQELNGQIEFVRDKEKEFSRLTESGNHIKQNISRLNEASQNMTTESEEIDQQSIALEEKEQVLSASFQEKESAIIKVIGEMDELQNNIAQKRSELNQFEVEQAGIRTRLTTIEGEKIGKEENIRIFASDLETMTGQFDVLGREETELVDKVKEFQTSIQEIEQETVGISEEVSVKRIELDKLISREKEMFEQRSAVDNRLRELEIEMDTLKSNMYDKKFELQKVQHEEEQICRDMLQLYQVEVTVEELLNQESVETPLNELLAKEEELARRLKYIGSVNLDAPREYEELNERYEFLEKQKNDIEEAREILKKALRKINKTSREMFLETFEKVSAEFKEMFKFLFAGGKADVVLLDPENVLESGVDIIVQPPGKKLQNVSLLSGGEKSMTAIALIFAIFKVKPSPLCILDEIDAALDEANVDRFNHILKDFAQSSQFLVITHNKKTIGVADVMYGVTMQQSGLSNIVSVRLTDSETKSSSNNRINNYTEHGHVDVDSLLDDEQEDGIMDGELVV